MALKDMLLDLLILFPELFSVETIAADQCISTSIFLTVV
jgi:hypothetical protein